MMTVREHFDRDLQGLSLSVMKLGSYVEEALRKALAALSDQNVQQAEIILAEDVKINKLQLEIENCCVSLIAREQPVARDLREIMTTIKVASNLERVGDLAVHLAKATKRLAGRPYIGPFKDIHKMAEIGIDMVHDSVDAFTGQDGAKAREVARRDDQIDSIHDALIQELLASMHKDDEQIEMSTSLLFISRFLERLGDHVVNICEWVVYGAEGTHVDLNS
jgi:phosphate transport system protein